MHTQITIFFCFKGYMVSFDTCGEERKEGAASGEINDEQFEFRQILQSFSRREDFKTVSQAKNNLGKYA